MTSMTNTRQMKSYRMNQKNSLLRGIRYGNCEKGADAEMHRLRGNEK